MDKNKVIDDPNYMLPSVFWSGMITRTVVFVLILVSIIEWSIAQLTWPMLPITIGCTTVLIFSIFLRIFFISKRSRYIASCAWSTIGILIILALATYFIWTHQFEYAYFVNPTI